jgi:regulator of sigma E protease
MNALISILGLALLILVHEAGHFFTARAVGMRPRKFYIGFPPAIAKFKRSGIEYGIGAIPLGGYVKIPGMHRPAAQDLEVHLGRAVHEAPELAPALARVQRDLELEDFDAARSDLPELERAVGATELSPAARTRAERGLPDVDDALAPDAYWRAASWKRIAVIFAGPGTNIVFAIALFAALFMIGTTEATSTVEVVHANRPAASAGLKPGDRIVAINGKAVTPNDISKTISTSGGQPLRITVQREGKRIALQPVRAKKDAGAYRIGINLAGKQGPGESLPSAIGSSFRLTGEVTREIGRSLLQLGSTKGRDQISSPVGIVRGSSAALKRSVQDYLAVLGLISLSLALLNLLPLLPLDGGHIVFSVVEGLRRRAVPRAVYERVSAFGIALVLLLFFLGLNNDLGG